MSVVIAFDTATPATVAGLRLASGETLARRDDPQPDARPNHAARLLAICDELLAEAGLRWVDVGRIGVGVGPGTFTGLRIGVATARALAQSTGAELVAVSTLHALAAGALEAAPSADRRTARSAVLAVIDARRGEAFAAGWDASGAQLTAPAAVAPDDLGSLAAAGQARWLAVGDGAVKFRAQLESAGVSVEPDDSALHLVGAEALCALSIDAIAAGLDQLVPDYVRRPDAELRVTP